MGLQPKVVMTKVISKRWTAWRESIHAAGAGVWGMQKGSMAHADEYGDSPGSDAVFVSQVPTRRQSMGFQR
jgi:hypothetical protein